jgi:NADPH-dependent 2,4-dienoyl-CoA reductase/sulfur reductase-like enzyme
MPPLLRPREPATITLAPRTATVAAECDVLVVGGGPAGLGAARRPAEDLHSLIEDMIKLLETRVQPDLRRAVGRLQVGNRQHQAASSPR